MTEYQAALITDEGQVYREPEWMPSPAEVAQARSELERKGVVRSLSRGPAGKQMVPDGEAPWLWLSAAAAWVVIWPAVIALRLGQEWGAAWLPWWLPVAMAALHLLALAGPVLLTEREADQGALRQRFGKVRTLAQMLALEPDEFETWVGMLFMLSGYRVKNTQYVADHGIDLAIYGGGIRYGLVQCKRYRGTVGEPVVRDLYGTLVHENADYGWLATTGGVSRQAREWASGKPLELWDGKKLEELVKKYG